MEYIKYFDIDHNSFCDSRSRNLKKKKNYRRRKITYFSLGLFHCVILNPSYLNFLLRCNDIKSLHEKFFNQINPAFQGSGSLVKKSDSVQSMDIFSNFSYDSRWVAGLLSFSFQVHLFPNRLKCKFFVLHQVEILYFLKGKENKTTA